MIVIIIIIISLVATVFLEKIICLNINNSTQLSKSQFLFVITDFLYSVFKHFGIIKNFSCTSLVIEVLHDKKYSKEKI